MESTPDQLNAMRKDADRRIIVELLPSFSMDEMRRVLLFLQQTISARGRGTVQGQLVPNEPVNIIAQVKQRKGFLNRRAPVQPTAPTELPTDSSAETTDGLDGRRLMLYRRLGQLSASQLDEVKTLLDQLSPIVAGDKE